MKKLILALAVVAGLSSIASAHEPYYGGYHHGHPYPAPYYGPVYRPYYPAPVVVVPPPVYAYPAPQVVVPAPAVIAVPPPRGFSIGLREPHFSLGLNIGR